MLVSDKVLDLCHYFIALLEDNEAHKAHQEHPKGQYNVRDDQCEQQHRTCGWVVTVATEADQQIATVLTATCYNVHTQDASPCEAATSVACNASAASATLATEDTLR
jgi:hypothetical protein